jgi:hypothetical protein
MSWNPAGTVIEVTCSAEPPRLRTARFFAVLVVSTRTSPNARLAGVTSMSIGRGTPVPVKLIATVWLACVDT